MQTDKRATSCRKRKKASLGQEGNSNLPTSATNTSKNPAFSKLSYVMEAGNLELLYP
jgi:hypothetical protein